MYLIIFFISLIVIITISYKYYKYNKCQSIKQVDNKNIFNKIVSMDKTNMELNNNHIEKPFLYKYSELQDLDIIQINNLWHICFPDLKYYTNKERGFSNDTKIRILKDKKKNAIVGYICGLETLDLIQFINNSEIDDKELYSIKNWNGLFINNLCVLPKYRKKGFGKLLINTLIEWCNNENKDFLHLLIDSNNTIALNIYKKIGFLVDKESFDSESKKNIYTMVLHLKNNKLNIDDLDENYALI